VRILLFRRKGWLRKEFDEKLLIQLEELREQWIRQKNLVEKSMEPSEEVLIELKMAELKYLYLLREAKKRPLIIGR
jgi:hypothetical protein